MHSTISRRLILPGAALLLAGLLFLLQSSAAFAGDASAAPAPAAGSQLLAALSGERADGGLEPRYSPRDPEPESGYNSDYIFGMTRGVADSTIHPAVKAPVFLLTIPLDLALMPFAAIGGLFG